MMARQHVTFAVGLTGAGLATTAYVAPSVESWVSESPWEALLFLLLVAGGALVPDLDHHKSTLTVKLGWLGWILSKTLRLFGVRHRGFMHSFLFAALSGLVFVILVSVASIGDYMVIFVGALLLFYASVTFAFVFGKNGRNPALVLALAVALAYGVHSGAVDLVSWWVPIAAFIGPLLHDLGDMLTKSKFAFWAPFTKKRVGSIVGFKTNTWFETGILRGVFFVWSLGAIAWVLLLSQGYLERTDFAAAVTDGQAMSEALPYVTWTLAP
jgi:uncharacterized metal-binding protein